MTKTQAQGSELIRQTEGINTAFRTDGEQGEAKLRGVHAFSMIVCFALKEMRNEEETVGYGILHRS